MLFIHEYGFCFVYGAHEHESYILLDSLLNLTDTVGDRKMQLEHYKEWGKLYHKLINQKQMTKNQLKILLLMVFSVTRMVLSFFLLQNARFRY